MGPFTTEIRACWVSLAKAEGFVGVIVLVPDRPKLAAQFMTEAIEIAKASGMQNGGDMMLFELQEQDVASLRQQGMPFNRIVLQAELMTLDVAMPMPKAGVMPDYDSHPDRPIPPGPPAWATMPTDGKVH